MTKMESFFRIFDFNHSLMDGGDKTINYEGVVITRDIPYLGLKAGATFHSCWWNVEDAYFHFINWKPGAIYQPNETSIKVNQFELAHYMVWFDKDLPKEK